MDWLLALCIAGGFVIGVGLLLVIGFASGEDSAESRNAQQIERLLARNYELTHQHAEEVDRVVTLEALLKENESIRSQYAYNIRELAKELRDAKKGKGDFALDA